MFYDSGDSSAITAMGNTFLCLNVHCVFSTKELVPTQRSESVWRDVGTSPIVLVLVVVLDL